MKRYLLGMAVLVLLPLGNVVSAEEVIEEIVVTATKRAASIQDVPIAVSAFSGEDLEARGVQDLYGLQEVSPSISVYSSNSESNGGTLRIRGVGTTGNNPGLEAAVGTFIDGVYRSRAGLAFSDLTDIERVEVLRGPQGTLFGKNTSAGALHIITKKPEFERNSMVSVSAGDYSSIRVQASTTGPIVDNVLAYRLAASYNERDGYYEDDFTSDDYNGRDRYSVKAQLLWTPTDAIESRFIFDYTDKDEDCCPARYESRVERETTIPSAFGGFLPYQTGSSTRRGPLSLGENAADLVDELIARLGRPLPRADSDKDDYDVGLNHKPFEEVEDWGIQNETTWQINDNLKMVSITAYREFEVDRGQDVEFSAADILYPQNTEESFENFSQEFQFTWSTDNIDFLAGAYFYTEDIDTNENLRLATQGAEYLARLQTGLVDQFLGLPPGETLTGTGTYPLVGFTGTTRGSALGTYDLATGEYIRDGAIRGHYQEGDGYFAQFTQETEGWSVFTHNVWHVTDRLDITIGARYSNEKKEAETIMNGVPAAGGTPRELLERLLADEFHEDPCNGIGAFGFMCNNVSWEDDETEKEWTGTVKVSYALTDDLNIYASYSRGYKAGGFNLDQQSIELDVFATWLATGGDARFLTPNGYDFELTPEFLAAEGIPASNGLTQFDCGNQAGVINPQPSDLDCAFFDDDHKFDPEFVDAYELGFKGQFLDGRLTTNVALFYSDFEDFQLNTFSGTGFLISNTDEMITKGAEWESTWHITDGVMWTLGITYADSRYGDDLNKKGASQKSLYLAQDWDTLEDFKALEDIEGRQITHSPYWQGSTSLFVEQPVGSLFAYGNLNVGYRGSHNTGSGLEPQKDVGDEVIVNLQLGLRSQDERWDLQFWARNLFDNQIETVIFNSVVQSGNSQNPGGSFSTFVGPPRMVGATLTSRF